MEHIALYRQFRPMNFDEIVEQKGPVSTLRQAVIEKKIGHAYLFSGQRGTGKTSIAKVFSRAINCLNPINGNPCNKCEICKGILDGTLMDVIEMDAASNNSVDNIRRICDEVNFAPSKTEFKVYIIDEVHMLSESAFNALLKTLEEPPKHAVFLLATTEPHDIPATILSRCQRYDFRRISNESIVGRLSLICEKEGFKAEKSALDLIASLSDGAMRDAISLLDQVGSAAGSSVITEERILQLTGTVDDAFLLKMSEALIKGDYESIVKYSDELSRSGRDTVHFALDLTAFFRNLLIVRMMPDPTTILKVQPSTLKGMYELVKDVAAETIVAYISSLSAVISDLKWSPDVRTTFEISLIRICGRKVKADVVPLTIPDFVTKQAEAAKTLSERFGGTVSAPVTPAVPAAPVAPVSPAAPVASLVSPSSETPKEETKQEAKPESKPISEKLIVPPWLNPVAKPAETKPSETKPVESKTAETKPVETPKAETKPSEVNIAPIPDPVPPPPMPEDDFLPPPPYPAEDNDEEKDPDDEPMENQIDIFSMSFNDAPQEEAAKPSEKQKNSVFANGNILNNLSASFLDDIINDKPTPEISIERYIPEMPPVESEPEEPDEPEEEAPVKPKTSLASLMKDNELLISNGEVPPVRTPVVDRNFEKKSEHESPADIKAMWQSICAGVQDIDFTLYASLINTDLRIFGDKAAIVFDDSVRKETLKELPKDEGYMKISNDIKHVFDEVEHVYVCTERQYGALLSKVSENTMNAGDMGLDNSSETPLDAFLKRSESLGITTEIHFGDD